MFLLVRNKVKDFDHWKQVFNAQAEPAGSAGLRLKRMWRSADNPNNASSCLK